MGLPGPSEKCCTMVDIGSQEEHAAKNNVCDPSLSLGDFKNQYQGVRGMTKRVLTVLYYKNMKSEINASNRGIGDSD